MVVPLYLRRTARYSSLPYFRSDSLSSVELGAHLLEAASLRLFERGAVVRLRAGEEIVDRGEDPFRHALDVLVRLLEVAHFSPRFLPSFISVLARLACFFVFGSALGLLAILLA